MLSKVGVVIRNAEKCILVSLLAAILIKHVYDIVTKASGILANSYIPVFLLVLARIRVPFIFVVLLFHMMALMVHYFFASDFIEVDSRFEISPNNSKVQAEYFFLMFGITFLSLYHAYLIEKLMRQDFIMLSSLKHSKNQAMEILKNMFPEEVVNHVIRDIQEKQEMKAAGSRQEGSRQDGTQSVGVRSIREDCGVVTVLFCDIMHFDSLTENLEARDLVSLLDAVWMMFDRIVQTNNLVKIETVKCTYMAASMSEDVPYGVQQAVITGTAMLDAVEKRVLGMAKTQNNVSVRIGIHTGPAMCGVVGSRKPQFALFGDTVNTASRMQSTGQENHVHVSAGTYEHIREDSRFSWTERKTQVKGKGLMDTYLLNRSSGRRKSTSTEQDRGNQSQAHLPVMSATSSMDTSMKRERSGVRSPPSGGRRRSSEKGSRNSGISDEKHSSNATQRLNATSPHNASDRDSGEDEESELDSATLPPGSVAKASERHLSMTHMNPARAPYTSALSAGKRSGVRLFGYISGQVQDRDHRERILNNQNLKSIWLSYQLCWACYAAESLCLLLGHAWQGRNSNQTAMLGIRVGYVIVALIGSVILHRAGERVKWGTAKTSGCTRFFTDFVALLVFLGFVASTVSNVAFLPDGSEFWNVFESFFFVMVLMHMYRTNLQGNGDLMTFFFSMPAVLSSTITIITVVVCSAFEKSGSLVWECIIYSLLMFATQILAVHGDPRSYRYEHKAICEEHDRVNQLLDSMLPQEVLSEMKMGRLQSAYCYDDMTLLFADIVGFTSYCATHKAEEAVNLVTRLFAEFDESTVMLQIYKVCTIGDAYVVVNEPRQRAADKHSDCLKVFRLAEAMIKIICRVREQVNHESLDMRIGLHCGSFVGGVIGTTRVRFDIWGEDVLIGNQIESEGTAGRICSSNEAKQVLEKCPVGPHLSFALKTTFQLSYSKRVVQTYVIDNAEGTDLLS